MLKKYINILLFPAIFVLFTSCSKRDGQMEGFLDFSPNSEEEFIQDINIEEEQSEREYDEFYGPPLADSGKIEGREKIDFLKTYNLRYLTFDVVDFYAEIKPIKTTDNYTRYKFRFYSRTNGTVDYFFNWMSHTVSYYRDYGDKIIPENFRTKVRLRKKVREIHIDYDQQGKIISEKVIPPDNRLKRPAVDDSLKTRTFGPLSIIAEVRRNVLSAFRDDLFEEDGTYRFTIPLYDARRRTDVVFTLYERKTNEDLHMLKMRRTPVAGFTDNEKDFIKQGTVSFKIFIDPTDMWPVRAEGSHTLGTASATYEGDCNKAFKECIKED
jgi:hypothetical protein